MSHPIHRTPRLVAAYAGPARGLTAYLRALVATAVQTPASTQGRAA
jgi:hypothetical protein